MDLGNKDCLRRRFARGRKQAPRNTAHSLQNSFLASNVYICEHQSLIHNFRAIKSRNRNRDNYNHLSRRGISHSARLAYRGIPVPWIVTCTPIYNFYWATPEFPLTTPTRACTETQISTTSGQRQNKGNVWHNEQIPWI